MKRLVLLFCLVTVISAFAQMPRTLNYQGTLAIGSTPVPDGNYNVTFRLYAASAGGSAVWSEAQLVATRHGVFNAVLGKIVPLPASFGKPYWMSLQVGADAELSPRLEMTGVSYSMHAHVADSVEKVTDGSIGSAALATGAVTSAKILDGTITGADIASGTITAADMLDEPGVASSFEGTSTLLNAGTIVYTIDSVEITLPAAGIVVLTASGYMNLSHVADTRTTVVVAIGTNPTFDLYHEPGAQTAGLAASLPEGTYSFPYSPSRVYQETTAGTKKYYLYAYYFAGPSTGTNIYSSLLTAMYFPTARGSLSKTGDDAPGPGGKATRDPFFPSDR